MPGCSLVAGHFQLLLSTFPSATRAGQLLFSPEKLLAALREGNSRRRSGDSAQEVETLPGAEVVHFALSMCMGPSP